MTGVLIDNIYKYLKVNLLDLADFEIVGEMPGFTLLLSWGPHILVT
jgi:hypothetical protein